MDGDTIMLVLPKVVGVRAEWINAILKGRKQVIQESLHIFVTVSSVWLIN